ncbi:MAG: Ty1/Copia family ribonuclease HI [Gloeomargaritales cyanobacterium]
MEMIEGLRYKLRMLGVPLDGPANGFCDNNSVVQNVSNPASTLKKKHNSIAYHKVRESTAAGIIRVCHEEGKFNVADMLTKILSARKLKECAKRCLF